MFEDLLVVWEGFLALKSAGLEPIRFSEIESWLNLNGIVDLNHRQEIAHLIRILDSEHLDLVKERKKEINYANS